MRFAFMTLIFVKYETYCDVTACLFASATQFITNCDRYYKVRWLLQIATDTAVVFLRRVLEGMSWWPRKQVIKCMLEDVSFCDRDRAFIKNNLFFLMKEKKREKSFPSLRKQPTFGYATTGFPTKLRLRNERRNSILMTRHYPELSRASDWLNQISHAAQPIKSTTQTWVVTRHQYGISALVPQTSFRGENVVASWNVGCFLRLSFPGWLFFWEYEKKTLSHRSRPYTQI